WRHYRRRVSSCGRKKSPKNGRDLRARAGEATINRNSTKSRGPSAMSEYQYYEFRAIDHPLDKRAMGELRAITSRATITPTSLVNEYHWGDFKGDPDKLMDRYFDAHL